MSPLDAWFLGGAGLFLLSALAYLTALWRPEGRALSLARKALTLGLIYWPLLLFCWWLQRGGEGVNRLLLGAASWSVAALYWGSLRRERLEQLGSVASVIAAVLGLFAFLFAQPLQLSPNASAWALYSHIALALLGLVAFSVSAGSSAFYLWAERRLKSKLLMSADGPRLPSLSTLDDLSLKGLLAGFPLYTLALLIGTIQALKSQALNSQALNSQVELSQAQAPQLITALGEVQLSYVLAALAWLIYGGVLQARLTAGWRGRRAAALTLIAFVGLFMVLALYSVRS